MQILLTLRPGAAPAREVELCAPAGTTVGDVADLLHHAAGIVDRPGDGVVGVGHCAESGVWIGSRSLAPGATLERVGLRSGCIIGVGAPGPRPRGPHAAVRLHVVSGPDAGRVTAVTRGRLRIGRDAQCHLQLGDPGVSRQHAELNVTPSGISVRDLDSRNGTTIQSASSGPVAVDGAGQELDLGSYFTVGETTLSVVGVQTPPAATAPGEDGEILVNRPARLDRAPPERLDLAPDPASLRGTTLPWVAALITALAGVGLAWFLHSPQFLAFALVSPIILLATTLSDRLSGGRLRRRTRVAAHHRRIATDAAVSHLADVEVAYRRRAHPDPASVLVTATTPGAGLWERRLPDPDFLDVRLGLGAAPARAVIRIGTDAIAPAVLPGLPAVVSMRDGPLGICGPRPLALPVARWIVGQLAVLHSPADLRVAALLSEDTEGDWEWLRWLPHSRIPGGQLRVARSPQDRRRLISELVTATDAGAPAAIRMLPGRRPWTVVLVDYRSFGIDAGALVNEARRAVAARITFVHLDVEARRLPSACTTIAKLCGETGSRIRIRSRSSSGSGDHHSAPGSGAQAAPFAGDRFGWPSGAGTSPDVARADEPGAGLGADPDQAMADDPVVDRVSEQWCDEVSRALAPLRDPGADQTDELPVSVRARDLFDLADLSPDTIRARWEQARGGAATPVGTGSDGPIEIDLARDGPHALVAGTTGAGKSELLQTLVAGLALHSPPTELQFVLIDYKGGAAFGDCARLPHTVGMVTDLDTQLTERALRSLDAELRRRETLFACARAVDLGAYRRTSQRGSEPVARVVLVVDEFASLAEELPDFVTGLVGIAQRGRSLGVHLVLATQRPAGVVSPEIRANTALRIALRMTDENDSTDVIGSDVAAQIDRHLPGRAVMRSAQSLIPLQVGRISAPVRTVHSHAEVIPLDRWGTPLETWAPRTDTHRTDLQDVVDALRAAWDADPVRLRRPWLDPLPARLDLAAIASPRPGSAGGGVQRWSEDGSSRVVLGLVDRPGEQAQVAFALDLREPTTMVFTGGPRSGRTSLLRTVAVTATHQLRVDQLHVYAVDCSGAGLNPLLPLPHCGAVVGRDAPASIAALIERLSRELGRRQQGGGNVDARPSEPALLLLLDGWEGFLDVVEEFDAGRTVDTFLHLVRDGTAAGLSVVVTGDRATLAARLSSAVQRRFVLRLSDPADYALAGLSRRQIPAAAAPGRAVDTADGGEIQLGLFGTDPSPQAQKEAVSRLVADAADRARCDPPARVPFAIRALPAHVHLDDVAARGGPGRVVLGLGGDSSEPVTIRIGSAPPTGPGLRFLVAGPVRSGRSTVLRTMVVQLARAGCAMVAAGGARSPFVVAARAQQIPTIDPESGPDAARSALEGRLADGLAVTLLIDDTEQFADTAAGDRLSALIRRTPPGLDVVGTGRTDDLALAFRGLAAEIKRARTGVLLQPGPGDGDLFGLRLPYRRSLAPPGRGLLIAPDLTADPSGTGAIPLQVALA